MDKSPIDVEFEEIVAQPIRPYAEFGKWLIIGCALLAFFAPKVVG